MGRLMDRYEVHRLRLFSWAYVIYDSNDRAFFTGTAFTKSGATRICKRLANPQVTIDF